MPLTSRANSPRTGIGDSPDNLPITGFTNDQLKCYILRQLGSPVWSVELTPQQISDAIQDALSLYSQYRPQIVVGNIQLTNGIFQYMQDADVGLGVVDVQFVEPNPVPTEIFYGNLINPAPLFRTGLDEYDSFLRWRHTWQRVTSIKPDWYHDEYRKVLYIHNPIERYQAGIFMYFPITSVEDLEAQGAEWVKRYALERARLTYGEILAKFSGAIPSPMQNLQLDQQKRDRAQAEIDKLMERLHGMQLSTPISSDDP